MACLQVNVINKVCTGHRAANSPGTSIAITPPTAGTIITAAKINELFTYLSLEIQKWRAHPRYNLAFNTVSGSLPVGTIIEDTRDINNENASIQSIQNDPDFYTVPGYDASGAGTAPKGTTDPVSAVPTTGVTSYTQSAGLKITALNYTELVNRYNALRVDCICNADCGCNTVCACHVDCGCNYSDMRLKMEICYC